MLHIYIVDLVIDYMHRSIVLWYTLLVIYSRHIYIHRQVTILSRIYMVHKVIILSYIYGTQRDIL